MLAEAESAADVDVFIGSDTYHTTNYVKPKCHEDNVTLRCGQSLVHMSRYVLPVVLA